MKTKVVAMYLPQYHRNAENDLWWGEGYTDWRAVKDSKPLYKGHNQPRIPYKRNYYDLSEVETIKKQADMATKYGIYGFGIYHYWFSSNQILLDKPINLIKNNKDVNTHYFLMWDNGSWKRTWSNVKFSNSWAPMYEKKDNGPEILAELRYGEVDEWEKHFLYLLPYFQDERYIKVNGKPLFGIFNQNNEPETLKKMFKVWDKMAKENGFTGIAILGKTNAAKVTISDYEFDYEPATHGWIGKNNFQKGLLRVYDNLRLKLGMLKKYDYDKLWKKILRDVNNKENYFTGAFVRYDDTPRRGKRSSIVIGDSPEKFQKNMQLLLQKTKQKNKEFVFLTAWNEWGEGAYLEPDEEGGFSYLEALKDAIDKIN